LAAGFGMPIISPTAGGSELSDKSQYPTFNRVVPPDDHQAIAMVKICLQYGWKRVGVMATTDSVQVATSLAFSK
jgi:ABC-type branched-subunit amino acid transport system substrate-binding protein